MPCKYEYCIFRTNSRPEDCARLCEICRIRKAERGQVFAAEHWNGSVVQVLEGAFLGMKLRPDMRPVTTAIHIPGSLYGLEKIFDPHGPADETRATYALTDCTLGVYSAVDMHNLIRQKPSLSHPILKKNVVNQMKDKTDMLLFLGYGDAAASISYAVDYLERHGIHDLTHEQIALVCNRSRQTVTTTLRQAEKKDDRA